MIFFENLWNVNIIIGFIFGVCILLSLLGLLHKMGILNKCTKIGDSDSIFVFIILGFRLSDFITDILFIVYLSEYSQNVKDIPIGIIFVISILTIIIPFILNIIYTFRVIKYKKWFNYAQISSYFYKNKVFIPVSVLTMDVILALKITKSKFLGLHIFNSGITSYEIYKFEYIKIISITISENIPTLIIQIMFISLYEFNVLSLVSIIFSSFSVLITLLNYFMNRERLNESIPVSYFVSFQINEKYYNKINTKIGLQTKLKDKIFNIIGSGKYNDIEIGSIITKRIRNNYLTKIHFISRMNQETEFDFDAETIQKVCQIYCIVSIFSHHIYMYYFNRHCHCFLIWKILMIFKI